MNSGHTAKSLFVLNIQGAEQCVEIYDGVSKLGSNLDLDWLLRSAIVLAVSAMDAYFHDKIRYRVGKLTSKPPKQLANLKIPFSEITKWNKAKRKGNVVRRWVEEHLAIRPLQSPNAIAEALKFGDIHDFWNTIEPNSSDRAVLLAQLNELVKRRNQIAHEGDRLRSRSSGKALRPITREYTLQAIEFVEELVQKTEDSFPR
jgi:hypothetical protein